MPSPAPDPAADRERLLVELVDESGAAAGTCPVREAHTAPGRRHRAFSVLLYDTGGRVLLQRRAAGKTRFPLLWSNTCCGHPAPGQDPAEAARTRLADELGITPAQLTPLAEAGAFHYTADAGAGQLEDEWDHVLVGTLTSDALSPDPAEVADTRWADPGSLPAEIAAHPAGYTPWLPGVLGLAGTIRPASEKGHGHDG